jgi:hypothetical protein
MAVKAKVKNGEPKEHLDADLLSVNDGSRVIRNVYNAGDVASVAMYAPLVCG